MNPSTLGADSDMATTGHETFCPACGGGKVYFDESVATTTDDPDEVETVSAADHADRGCDAIKWGWHRRKDIIRVIARADQE